jgi:hypothetical protein
MCPTGEEGRTRAPDGEDSCSGKYGGGGGANTDRSPSVASGAGFTGRHGRAAPRSQPTWTVRSPPAIAALSANGLTQSRPGPRLRDHIRCLKRVSRGVHRPSRRGVHRPAQPARCGVHRPPWHVRLLGAGRHGRCGVRRPTQGWWQLD